MDDLTVSFLKNGIQKLSEQFTPFTCYIIPRNSVSSSFTEIDKKMCLYFLIDSEEGLKEQRKLYIGETSNCINRLNDHKGKKSWWDKAIVFCASKPTFTSDTVLGLEKIMIEKYKVRNDLYDLDNSKSSNTPIDAACYKFELMVQEFLDYLRYGLNHGPVSVKIMNTSFVTPVIKNNTKRAAFKFSMCGLKTGDVIYLEKNNSVTCTIKDDNTVIYNGQEYSLSSLAKILLGYKHMPQGPACWCYNGETLDEIRKKNGF